MISSHTLTPRTPDPNENNLHHNDKYANRKCSHWMLTSLASCCCMQVTAEKKIRFATCTQPVFADDYRWHPDFPVPLSRNAHPPGVLIPLMNKDKHYSEIGSSLLPSVLQCSDTPSDRLCIFPFYNGHT